MSKMSFYTTFQKVKVHLQNKARCIVHLLSVYFWRTIFPIVITLDTLTTIYPKHQRCISMYFIYS